jgi:hypothetical protein
VGRIHRGGGEIAQSPVREGGPARSPSRLSLSAARPGELPRAAGDYRGAVAFEVTCTSGVVRVELRGWDRLFTWRRSLVVDLATVRSASIESRGVLEAEIDHRAAGFGTHNGGKRPCRRRVGTMLGGAVRGRQFWAVSSGSSTVRLLVLDLESGPFARVVLEVDGDVEACVMAQEG